MAFFTVTESINSHPIYSCPEYTAALHWISLRYDPDQILTHVIEIQELDPETLKPIGTTPSVDLYYQLITEGYYL